MLSWLPVNTTTYLMIGLWSAVSFIVITWLSQRLA